MTELDTAFIHQIEAEDAWNLLSFDPDAALIDVRRDDEITQYGHPDLGDLNGSTWRIEWRCDRVNSIKAHFVMQIEEALDATSATHLIFYCDDGRRALSAAKVVAGNLHAPARRVDVSSIIGAEDPGAQDCWRDAGLPWLLPSNSAEPTTPDAN